LAAVKKIGGAIAALVLLAGATVAAGGAPSAFGKSSLQSRCDGPFPLKPPKFNRSEREVNHRLAGSQQPMSRGDAHLLVRAVWNKLYKRCHHKHLTPHQLQYRVAGNLRQIQDDSGFVPAAVSPVGAHNKGLLQLNDQAFKNWSIPGYHDVFHPLDDLMAAVNIQLNADTLSVIDGYHYRHDVLDGRHHGWGAHGGDNPWHPFR